MLFFNFNIAVIMRADFLNLSQFFLCSSAFFHGQIEKPTKGLAVLLDHYDKKVLVGINREGIHIIDAAECVCIFILICICIYI